MHSSIKPRSFLAALFMCVGLWVLLCTLLGITKSLLLMTCAVVMIGVALVAVEKLHYALRAHHVMRRRKQSIQWNSAQLAA